MPYRLVTLAESHW